MEKQESMCFYLSDQVIEKASGFCSAHTHLQREKETTIKQRVSYIENKNSARKLSETKKHVNRLRWNREPQEWLLTKTSKIHIQATWNQLTNTHTHTQQKLLFAKAELSTSLTMNNTRARWLLKCQNLFQGTVTLAK